jgi:hypothetical protein
MPLEIRHVSRTHPTGAGTSALLHTLAREAVV